MPPSLAAEGRMMLQALLHDLRSVPDLELILSLDERCLDFSLPFHAEIVVVGAFDDIDQLLPELIAQVDAVWPIAPETEDILAGIAQRVKKMGKTLLLSDPEMVTVCGNKLTTFECLKACSLPVVDTLPLGGLGALPFIASVIKPIDGVGCEGNIILNNPEQFPAALAGLGDTARYLIQPLCEGRAISLSCLFKRGRAWLLCCNWQEVDVVDNCFSLRACWVNAESRRHGYYQDLIDRVAQAMPGLWGYVGIDLIETDEEAWILEINPRLTTSYGGILAATGINVAEQVLGLLQAEPVFQKTRDRTVTVNIEAGSN